MTSRLLRSSSGSRGILRSSRLALLHGLLGLLLGLIGRRLGVLRLLLGCLLGILGCLSGLLLDRVSRMGSLGSLLLSCGVGLRQHSLRFRLHPRVDCGRWAAL